MILSFPENEINLICRDQDFSVAAVQLPFGYCPQNTVIIGYNIYKVNVHYIY